jgi:hypothetical protein
MGFWDDKYAEYCAERGIPQSQPQQPHWLQPQVPQAPPDPRLNGYQPLPQQRPGPAPDDLCPRCGSSNYAEVALDTSMGGRMVGGPQKRCFDCRYPNFNASGDVIRTAGRRYDPNAQTMQVRQGPVSQGNQQSSGWTGMDNAVNIDHLVGG